MGLSDRNHRPKGITKVTVFYFADLTEAVGEASSFVVFRTRLSFDGWLHRVTAVWTGWSLITDLQLALGAFDEHDRHLRRNCKRYYGGGKLTLERTL